MNILIVPGSLRKDSLNRQAADIAKQILADKYDATVTMLEWSNVPLFDADIEFPTPESVKNVRDAVLAADGIWFFTPEYNFQIPGGLKNLTDWLSRTMVEGADWTETAVRNKPAAISGVGGNHAAAGARELLAKVLQFIGMKVLPESVGIVATVEELTTSRLVNVDPIKAQLSTEADEFVAFINSQKK